MREEIKAKARQTNFKNKPSFEIMDVTDAEREKGEKVAAYQAKKEQEIAAIRALEQQR